MLRNSLRVGCIFISFFALVLMAVGLAVILLGNYEIGSTVESIAFIALWIMHLIVMKGGK